MKKLFALMLSLMLLLTSVAMAETAPVADAPVDAPAAWYELSAEDTVLTVRLPGNNKDGMNWNFEISNPEALELITMEVIEGESEGMAGAPTTYVASFMSTASAENTVSLILKYASEDPAEAAFATRVLELNVSAENVISVASVLDRNQNADWLTFEDDGYMMLVTLPEQENEEFAWSISITDTDILELITCDTTEGFVGSFFSPMTAAGTVELTLSYGKRDSEIPAVMYTVNLFVNESGELLTNWVDVFTIFESAPVMPEGWLENDTDNCILTVTLPGQEGDGKVWSFTISDEDVLQLITCDTTEGFVGSFMASMVKAGKVDLTLTYGTADAPEAVYTVNLFVNEAGDLFVKSTDVTVK